ncbi:hypothetical protein MTBLM1_80024 [Rhodospirillaceae bacterium LM-1]|nr:hypothetical protein MTBLM1_80024 [Rhodospirillaceae bacterium LM-1]
MAELMNKEACLTVLLFGELHFDCTDGSF